MNSLTLTPRSSASFLKRRLSSGETSRVTRWVFIAASVGMHMIIPCACAAALSSSVHVRAEERQAAEHQEEEHQDQQAQHEVQVAEDQAGHGHAVALEYPRRAADFAACDMTANDGTDCTENRQREPTEDAEHQADDGHGVGGTGGDGNVHAARLAAGRTRRSLHRSSVLRLRRFAATLSVNGFFPVRS